LYDVRKQGFGTGPVFMATISTILGAILFLRMGYAVGHLGFWSTIAIILLGHIVTIATAFAVAEIATNQRVEGGGAYYIISRSFGLNVGAAIGIALFLAQAISVAFYVIALAEAFQPVLQWLHEQHGIFIPNKRFISLPLMGLLTLLMLTKGAHIGVKTLYLVVAILFFSLLLFFMGHSSYASVTNKLIDHIENPDNFFYVFTIIFPAFTGIAAGLGLSGDLRDPKKSIPVGTISATLAGMVVYILVAYKLAVSASPESLVSDQLIMSRIAVWGPVIPIGLACAALSSALGSVMIAPRTLQALGADRVFPVEAINENLRKTRAHDNEPFIAGMVTCAIAFFFVAVGDIDSVARIISMFFVLTYGAICLISFLEHFAADPAYRPTFRSKWYFSFVGAVLCFWLMFKMDPTYAIAAIVLMVGFYFLVNYFNTDTPGLSNIFRGVIFQLSRQLQVFLQKTDRERKDESWRPSVVCISSDTFKRLDAFELLKWLAHRYGFGTYIHAIKGYLSKASREESIRLKQRLLNLVENSRSNVYIDTIVSPSFTSAIAQVAQLPGVSGKENNMFMFEYLRREPSGLRSIIDNLNLVSAAGFDVCILGSTEKGFGYRSEMHIWITSNDYENANLMILLGYIILGHPDWRHGDIKIFAVYPENRLEKEKSHLLQLIRDGRLPISPMNVEAIPRQPDEDIKTLINKRSVDADLTIVGFRIELLLRQGETLFAGYDQLGNVLFVNARAEKEII